MLDELCDAEVVRFAVVQEQNSKAADVLVVWFKKGEVREGFWRRSGIREPEVSIIRVLAMGFTGILILVPVDLEIYM